jgi:hypothetical protein
MTSIIFQNFFNELYKSSKDLNSEYEEKKFYGIDFFGILERIPKDNIIIYIIIVFFVFSFINRFNIKLNEIFSFLICILLIYFLIRVDYSNFVGYTKEKQTQLNFLHKLMYENKKDYISASPDNVFIMPFHPYEKSYLFLDPLIVQLFMDIKPVSSFNIDSYVNSLFHCNNILGIEYESQFGLNREYLNYSTALSEKAKAMNALNSCMYEAPAGTVLKIMKSIKILQSLLNAHLRNIGDFYKNSNVVNDFTIFSKPDDFYDIDFVISPDDTKTRDYISTYNMYT